MSGIGAIFNFDAAGVNAEKLQMFSESLSSHGPDGTSLFCSANIGMCFSALHTTRESRLEKQPLITPDGDVLVTLWCDQPAGTGIRWVRLAGASVHGGAA